MTGRGGIDALQPTWTGSRRSHRVHAPTVAVRAVAIGLFVGLIQLLLVRRISVAGVRPDVLVLAVVVVGVTSGRRGGALTGLAAGFAADTVLLSPVGLSALAYAAAGAAAGHFSSDAQELPWVSSAIAVAASGVAVVAYVVLGLTTGSVSTTPARVLHVVAVVAAINGLLAPFVIATVRRGRWSAPRADRW